MVNAIPAIGFLILLGLVQSVAPSVPALDLFHPISIGAVWIYQVEEEGKPRIQSVTVESNAKGHRATLHTISGKRSLRFSILRTDRAWCLRTITGQLPGIRWDVEQRFSPPVPVLMVPEQGETRSWKWKGESSGWGGSVTEIQFSASFVNHSIRSERLEVHAVWKRGNKVLNEYTATYEAGVGLVEQTAIGYSKQLIKRVAVASEKSAEVHEHGSDLNLSETE